MITPGKYTRDQIQAMGLSFDEVTSAQTVGGKSYKLDNPGDGSRIVREVTLVGSGQGSGGFKDIGSSQSPSPISFSGFNQPTIDLPSIYKNLQEGSGISQLEKELSDKEKQKIEAEGIINDNPFLSEGTRVGRVAKIEDLHQKRTANLRNDIATKKADIETQLNLQTKQFDINSQQAQLALQQFNTLLGAGAFDSASGEDIANITRATGLSSSMVQSAIQANKTKNLSTEMVSFDDGVNQGFKLFTIDPMGNIVSQSSQVTGPSSKVLNANNGGIDVDSFLQSILNQTGADLGGIDDLWNY